jgi:M6 family metalloprotease-like protein
LSRLTVAAVAAVLLASHGLAATLDDFTRPHAGVGPVSGTVPLLVVLLGPNPTDPADVPSATQAQIRNAIFGPRPSVRTYFAEVSYGTFGIREAMTTPWLVAQDDPATPEDESSHAFIHTSDIHKKGAWLIRQVERMTNFRFGDYDRDRDGRVTADELAVIWIYPGASGRGRETDPAVVPVPSLSRGVELGLLARAGDQADWATIAHELAHELLKLGDLYADNAGYPGVGRASLMCDQAAGAHLDPWARIKLGWLRPTLVAEDGWYGLSDVESFPEALILHDPGRGAKDYFIVENRWPGASHESFQAMRGLAVWRIAEHGTEGDWARNTIDLVWAAGPPPASQINPGTCAIRNDALFDGAAAATAYAPSPNSSPGRLVWRDGTPSNIAVWHIPPASDMARVYIDVPPLQRPAAVASPVAMAGTSRDLGHHRSPYGFRPAAGRQAADIVGMAIGRDDHVYAWYRDGTVSAGTSADLDTHRPPYAYRLPPGRTPSDIVGMGIAGDDHVYAWYRDGTVSAGTYADLGVHRQPYAYRLPPGYTPADVVEMAVASDDHVYAWYRDGMVSAGTSRELDAHRQPYRYALPLDRVPGDVVGIDIAGDDHVYAWLDGRGGGAHMVVTAHASPGGVGTGGSATLVVKAADHHGRPLANAAVDLAATAGWFPAGGSGTTDAAGLLQLAWRAPPSAPSAYGGRVLIEIRARRAGHAEGRGLVEIPLITAPIQ